MPTELMKLAISPDVCGVDKRAPSAKKSISIAEKIPIESKKTAKRVIERDAGPLTTVKKRTVKTVQPTHAPRMIFFENIIGRMTEPSSMPP